MAKTDLVPVDHLADDEPNRQLRSHVDAKQHALAPTPSAYDFVAIGGGTAGLVAVTGMAMLGARCALIERAFTGGDCLVTGCVPSKALLHVGNVAHAARQAGRVGVSTGEVDVDFAKAMEYVRTTRASIAPDDSISSLRDRGVDVIAGSASFSSERSLVVDGAEIRFKRALVATGGRPRLPPIPGLDAAGALTSETLFELTTAPQHLAVIGGGPIGCEMSQAFARLGIQVTLLERGDRILGREDPEASALVAASLTRDGVDIRCNTEVVSVNPEPVALLLKRSDMRDKNANETLACSHILVATGRVPNVESLELERAGIAFGKGGVDVDKRFRTSNRRVYAAGDVASKEQFTHAAWAQAEYAVLNAFFPVWLDIAGRIIPHATYTQPEVAHVGPSHRDLQKMGDDVDVLSVPMSHNDRARTEDDTEGFARVYLRKGTDRIVAATIVGSHAADLIVELGAAMTSKRGLSKLVSTVRPYPTRAAIVQALAYEYSTQRVTPWMRRAAQWWIGLLR